MNAERVKRDKRITTKASNKMKHNDVKRSAKLLFTRTEVKEMLSVSDPKLVELENLGLLTPLKLGGGGSNSTVRYRKSEIEKLIGESI
jgi:hypothetical protein